MRSPRGASPGATPGAAPATIPYLERKRVTDNRNVLLAIALSLIVLLGWGYVTQRWMPANPPATRVENGRQVAVPRPQASPAAQSQAAARDLKAVLPESPRIAIATPFL